MVAKSFAKGISYGIPISLVLWAGIIVMYYLNQGS